MAKLYYGDKPNDNSLPLIMTFDDKFSIPLKNILIYTNIIKTDFSGSNNTRIMVREKVINNNKYSEEFLYKQKANLLLWLLKIVETNVNSHNKQGEALDVLGVLGSIINTLTGESQLLNTTDKTYEVIKKILELFQEQCYTQISHDISFNNIVESISFIRNNDIEKRTTGDVPNNIDEVFEEDFDTILQCTMILYEKYKKYPELLHLIQTHLMAFIYDNNTLISSFLDHRLWHSSNDVNYTKYSYQLNTCSDNVMLIGGLCVYLDEIIRYKQTIFDNKTDINTEILLNSIKINCNSDSNKCQTLINNLNKYSNKNELLEYYKYSISIVNVAIGLKEFWNHHYESKQSNYDKYEIMKTEPRTYCYTCIENSKDDTIKFANVIIKQPIADSILEFNPKNDEHVSINRTYIPITHRIYYPGNYHDEYNTNTIINSVQQNMSKTAFNEVEDGKIELESLFSDLNSYDLLTKEQNINNNKQTTYSAGVLLYSSKLNKTCYVKNNAIFTKDLNNDLFDKTDIAALRSIKMTYNMFLYTECYVNNKLKDISNLYVYRKYIPVNTVNEKKYDVNNTPGYSYAQSSNLNNSSAYRVKSLVMRDESFQNTPIFEIPLKQFNKDNYFYCFDKIINNKKYPYGELSILYLPIGLCYLFNMSSRIGKYNNIKENSFEDYLCPSKFELLKFNSQLNTPYHKKDEMIFVYLNKQNLPIINGWRIYNYSKFCQYIYNKNKDNKDINTDINNIDIDWFNKDYQLLPLYINILCNEESIKEEFLKLVNKL